MWNYVIARLGERSTLAGAAVILTALGFGGQAEWISNHIEIIAGIVGGILALMPEKSPDAPKPSGTPPLGIGAAVLLAALGLSACAGDAVTKEEALKAACIADAVGQPIAAAVVSVAAPEAAPYVALDSKVVHPTIQAECADAMKSD